ncbi:hypothetical protein HMPREF0208_02275 [Citrobacter koseri]|nr:hypothetical protein HMPREF0208_02275 [Citrobacter koseri]
MSLNAVVITRSVVQIAQIIKSFSRVARAMQYPLSGFLEADAYIGLISTFCRKTFAFPSCETNNYAVI